MGKASSHAIIELLLVNQGDMKTGAPLKFLQTMVQGRTSRTEPVAPDIYEHLVKEYCTHIYQGQTPTDQLLWAVRYGHVNILRHLIRDDDDEMPKESVSFSIDTTELLVSIAAGKKQGKFQCNKLTNIPISVMQHLSIGQLSTATHRRWIICARKARI